MCSVCLSAREAARIESRASSLARRPFGPPLPTRLFMCFPELYCGRAVVCTGTSLPAPRLFPGPGPYAREAGCLLMALTTGLCSAVLLSVASVSKQATEAP